MRKIRMAKPTVTVISPEVDHIVVTFDEPGTIVIMNPGRLIVLNGPTDERSEQMPEEDVLYDGYHLEH